MEKMMLVEKRKQTTIYLDKKDLRRLSDLLYIKADDSKKPTRSDLISEGLQLLHDKYVPKFDVRK